MKLTIEEIRTLYQQQTARPRAGHADCVSEEVMTRAATGELGQSEREKIADHMMVCFDCAQEYRILYELKPWAEQAAVSAGKPASMIKSVREPVREWLDKGDRVVPSRPRWPQRLIGIFSPGYAGYALAAMLLVISLISVAWVISSRRETARITARLNEQLRARDQASESLAESRRRLEETSRRAEQEQKEIAELRRSIEELSQPQVNVPIADLELQGVRDVAESEIVTVTVPAGANLFTLILHVTGERSFPDYALEVIDGRGQRVFRAQGLRRSEIDTFHVVLPRRLLPAGRYRLRLYGLGAGKNESLGDYSMRVRYQ